MQSCVCALQVFDQMGMINLLQDTNATLNTLRPDIAAIPDVQRSSPTVHNCGFLHQGWWHWQRLTVPTVNTTFRPSPNVSAVVFPPLAYSNLPAARNVSTPFFRGFAATIAGPALTSTNASRDMLLSGLKGPPGRTDEAGYRHAMKAVLQQSGTLDDRKKVIAECECRRV